METFFTPDWITATTKVHSIKQIIERFSFGMGTSDWITAKATNGYEHALRHPYGHVVRWTNKRDDMGVNVLFTGMPLKEIHDAGYSTLEIISWLCEEEFKFSRLDLAVDVHGIKFDLEEMQRRKFTGSVNKMPQLRKNGPNAEEGSTLEIGSRSSDKYLRIYDKAGQMDLKGILWFRFEIELGGRTATKVAHMIKSMTFEQAGKFTQGMIKAMYTPEYEDFLLAMAEEPHKVSSTKETSHQTYDWLMGTVSKSLARVILELPHRDVLRTFEQEVEKHIRELAAKSLTQRPE